MVIVRGWICLLQTSQDFFDKRSAKLAAVDPTLPGFVRNERQMVSEVRCQYEVTAPFSRDDVRSYTNERILPPNCEHRLGSQNVLDNLDDTSKF